MNEFNPKQILSPVDLSQASTPVLHWAGYFAATFGSAVEVFHADHMEAPVYFTSGQLATLNEQRAAHRASLERMLQDLVTQSLSARVSRTITISEGPAVDELQKRLEKKRPDLIVMGAHGRTGMKRVLLGSVAENLIRIADSPILIVPARGGKQAQPEIKTVVCPVNFTESAKQSLLLSASLASAFKAELRVLHAAEDGEESARTVREHLCSWIPGDVRASCAVTETVRTGNASEQILGFAGESEADLIVMVAEHRPFLEWSTIGTTTIRVMRHSEIPVLIVPGKSS